MPRTLLDKRKKKAHELTVLINGKATTYQLSREQVGKLIGRAEAAMGRYINDPESMTIRMAKDLCKGLEISGADFWSAIEFK